MSETKKQESADSPKPFGVDYVPYAKRVRPKKGEPAFVGLVSEIPPGKAKAIVLDKFRIAVFNIEGKFYAIKDACPHAEYPLSKSVLHGDIVACASHNWQFNVRTGHCVRGEPPLDVKTFEVEIRGDEVWVRP